MTRYGILLLLLCAACDPGPIVYLGRAPEHDAGPDASVHDAGRVDDAGAEPNGDGDDPEHEDDDRGDDDLIPCRDESNCDHEAPFCHGKWLVCVECLADDDCSGDEHCTRGSCRDNDSEEQMGPGP